MVIEMRNEANIPFLREFCQEIKNKIGEEITLVEIGAYSGQSAEIFAQEFPQGKIYCIDPWLKGYDPLDIAASSNMMEVEKEFDKRALNYSNIIKIKGFSLAHNIPCDGVYIDGIHTYEGVKNDINHWKNFAKKFISGHDYYDEKTWEGVFKAVNEYGIPDKIFGDSSWLKWK